MLYNIKIFSILTFINPYISSPSHLQPQNSIPYPNNTYHYISHQLPAIFHHHSLPYISYQLPANVGTYGCVRPLVRSPITPPLPRASGPPPIPPPSPESLPQKSEAKRCRAGLCPDPAPTTPARHHNPFAHPQNRISNEPNALSAR